MAEERFPCRRPPSIVATRSESVMLRAEAISLRPFQKASSRLTLVLCPAMTIERLTTGDFIDLLHCRSGDRRVHTGLLHPAPWQEVAQPSVLQTPPDARLHAVHPSDVRLAFGRSSGW